jgi:NTE family protein
MSESTHLDSKERRTIKKIIFSGGGVKGISYIGVIKCLDELRNSGDVIFDINEVCCVSIGSFVGLLYVLGYTYTELYDEIMSVNINDMKDFKIKNFVTKYGLDNGKTFTRWIERLIIKRGFSKDITLKQIWNKLGVNFRIVVANINKYKLEIFDYRTNPNLKVTKAIRMSTSIPFVFCAEKYNGCIYVDGGILNNYPIEMYSDNLDNVLGCKLMTRGEIEGDTNIESIDSLDSYISQVMGCFFAYKERHTTLAYRYLQHTICIDAFKITSPVNFELTDDEKIRLIEMGYKSTFDYFKNYEQTSKDEDK